mmetsp:Transcript_63026/g.181286  ORF Transcript_63026/g.181286 Transcript_63026/m.181286 type:complete len:264 (+) Transcript_63026:103-894(+)
MAMPPAVVGLAFLVCVLCALAFMAYLAWRGSQPTDFFCEAVASVYEMEMPEKEIDAYYTLKESLQKKYAPESLQEREETDENEEAAAAEPWTRKVPVEERQVLQKALMQRLVACIGKLDQVQKDKPGNWKLWQTKLISERFWSSLCDAEKAVSQEVDSCVAEAQEIEPGWKEHIFPQAVQLYRMQKQQEVEKKVAKKEQLDEKKMKEREVKRAEIEKRLKEEEKLREEKMAEKMMQKLLEEEERNAKAKGKAKGKAKPAAKKK